MSNVRKEKEKAGTLIITGSEYKSSDFKSDTDFINFNFY